MYDTQLKGSSTLLKVRVEENARLKRLRCLDILLPPPASGQLGMLAGVSYKLLTGRAYEFANCRPTFGHGL